MSTQGRSRGIGNTRSAEVLNGKQGDLGVFPADWTLWPLAALGEIRGRVGWRGYTKHDLRTSGPLTVGAKHIDAQHRLDLTEATHLSREKFLESPEIAIEPKDILIVQRGTIGAVVLIDRDIGEATINPSMVILRVRHADSRYAFYQLIADVGQQQILGETTSTGVPMITQKQIGKFRIPLPPTLDEQIAIAEALSDVDELLEALEALIAKKRAIKRAAMQQLLTAMTRLSGFAGEWETKRLGEIATIAIGRTPSRANATFWGRGHIWLSIGDLHTKIVNSSKEQITDLAAAGMKVVPAGTLLMSFKLSIGKVCFAGCDLFTNEAICSLADLRADAGFLYYALSTADFSLHGKQAVKGYTLNSESLKQVQVSLPDREEQTAIAAVLAAIDAELAALEARRDKTRAIKQGMMQQLLTGRVRLVKPASAEAGA